MSMMICPWNGPQKKSEFIRGRDVREMPDPATCSDETWAKHLFKDDKITSEVLEWWMHAPTSYWFIARRNTKTEEIIETYTVEEFFGGSATGIQSVKEAA